MMSHSKAWDMYVGATTPTEFMSNALDLSVEEAVKDYVSDLPNIHPEWFDGLLIGEKKHFKEEITAHLIAHIKESI